MTTIDDIIDVLARKNFPRGNIFLVNLHHTIRRGLVDVNDLKAVLASFLTWLSSTSPSAPTPHQLMDYLGNFLISKELWLQSSEPKLEEHLPKKMQSLTRITSYTSFFMNVVNRKRGMPRILGLPEPPLAADIMNGRMAEISSQKIKSVKKMIDGGKWKDKITGDILKFNTLCVWLAPTGAIMKKEAKVKQSTAQTADFHRDVLGLSHFSTSHHLIRLDFDVEKWADISIYKRRRPHGAGNGGNRFRLEYDGKPADCNWGRTVDLSRVEQKTRAANLNGVPELLMQGFSISKKLVTATYLGRLKNPPEIEDEYFLSRLRKTESMIEIVSQLKMVLT